jgi:hypothetical protein
MPISIVARRVATAIEIKVKRISQKSIKIESKEKEMVPTAVSRKQGELRKLRKSIKFKVYLKLKTEV